MAVHIPSWPPIDTHAPDCGTSAILSGHTSEPVSHRTFPMPLTDSSRGNRVPGGPLFLPYFPSQLPLSPGKPCLAVLIPQPSLLVARALSLGLAGARTGRARIFHLGTLGIVAKQILKRACPGSPRCFRPADADFATRRLAAARRMQTLFSNSF